MKDIIIREISVNSDPLEFIEKWQSKYASKDSQYYRNVEVSNKILEISSVSFFENKIDSVKLSTDPLAQHIKSDIKQELLRWVETVIPNTNYWNNSKYLQLRHVEVPLNKFSQYRKWREESIYDHVKKYDVIKSFEVFHSLFSTIPGVMFLSSFSCDIEDYIKVFNNTEYREIVKQAGNNFICGGELGLYTTIYERLK